MSDEEILLGDIVSVNHGFTGRKEGLVIGSHIDYLGRQIVEVQLEPGEIYHAWYPTVTRVKRTIAVQRPAMLPPARSHRTVERRIYW